LLGQRLRDESRDDVAGQGSRYQRLVDELRTSRIALDTDTANEQHYELPAEFFQQVLGSHLKYSSGYWDRGATSLDEAEAQMLELYAQRGEISDGQRILDLGCGWGSFSLWAAGKFPNSQITAVSNSTGQRQFILAQAEARGLDNVSVITGDINQLELDDRFDRVDSIEMFEHMRNYALLMNRIESWLNPGGKLFVHIFCHQNLLYPYDSAGDGNWMGRYFFTSGLMPAADTLLYFQDDLRIEQRWQVSGTNYAKTAAAWLENLDSRHASVRALMADCYGEAQADTWTQRWRMFFMACEELFAYRQGQEWLVCHYRFGKRT
jgi:cyclopropane-fatty-acyl-phospholipid synthase